LDNFCSFGNLCWNRSGSLFDRAIGMDVFIICVGQFCFLWEFFVGTRAEVSSIEQLEWIFQEYVMDDFVSFGNL
jgi:hypothetical protein